MELVSRNKLSERLGICPQTLRNYERRGVVPAANYPGGKRSLGEIRKIWGDEVARDLIGAAE